MTIRSLFSSIVSVTLLLFTATADSLAQDAPTNPVFLIARPELPNELFEKSVILMLPSDENEETGLIVGIIVNKPTRKKLSDVFPKERSLGRRPDPVYFGGPVGIDTPGAIFRAATADKTPEKALHVFADVYVTFDSDSIVSLLKKSKPGASVRVFLGRAQWGTRQLQNEMLRHAWYRETAEPSLVFSPSPEDLWQTLVKRAESGSMAFLQCGRVSNLPLFVLPVRRDSGGHIQLLFFRSCKLPGRALWQIA